MLDRATELRFLDLELKVHSTTLSHQWQFSDDQTELRPERTQPGVVMSRTLEASDITHILPPLSEIYQKQCFQ